MKRDSYNEQRERGNFSFPVEYHYVTNHHPRYNMPYHWHIQYEIIRVLEGKIVISIDENEYTASAGDIIFITDGCVHGGKAFLENTIYECMVFDKKLFETNVGDKNILQKFFERTKCARPKNSDGRKGNINSIYMMCVIIYETRISRRWI